MRPTMDRRQFLRGAVALGGATLLSGCGSSSGSGSASTQSRPGIGKESGNLSILEWGGYEAHGTKAQTVGLMAGADYTAKYGANGITYTYIVNDDQALTKATQTPFDLLHPCHENIPDYVTRGLVQPWDTSLLPSFKNLNPFLVKMSQFKGPGDSSPQQYMIPWDWGYASLLYRSDKIAPSDATGWELAWNDKYSKKISLWDGSASNMEVAALKLGFPRMDYMSQDQINQAQASLIQQKPLNKFYWQSEYSQMQPAFKSGEIWITYAWQDALVSMQAAKLKVAYLDPSQGRLSWFCGFMLGKNTNEYYHAHKYVESFINHASCVQMTNLFYYGTADATITPAEIQNKQLAKALDLSNPHAIAASDVHLQSWEPNRAAYETAWAQVQAA